MQTLCSGMIGFFMKTILRKSLMFSQRRRFQLTTEARSTSFAKPSLLMMESFGKRLVEALSVPTILKNHVIKMLSIEQIQSVLTDLGSERSLTLKSRRELPTPTQEWKSLFKTSGMQLSLKMTSMLRMLLRQLGFEEFKTIIDLLS